MIRKIITEKEQTTDRYEEIKLVDEIDEHDVPVKIQKIVGNYTLGQVQRQKEQAQIEFDKWTGLESEILALSK